MPSSIELARGDEKLIAAIHRSRRLIGRKADGWLPSESYLEPGDIERGNRIIDEAATAAGRDPREIRRLLDRLGRP